MKSKYYFYRLPAELVEEHGLVVAGVYAILLNSCAEGVYRADIKLETLAQKCKMSKRSAQYTIDQLEELGLVRRVKEGRRTVYDIVAVLPPKQHKADYLPESGHLRGDTYEDLILRVPNMARQEHFREQLKVLGYSIKDKAAFSLRQLDSEAERVKSGVKWAEHVEEIGTGNAINEVLYGMFSANCWPDISEAEGQMSFFEGAENNGQNK